MAFEKATGFATVYANGKTYRTKAGAKLMTGGYNRTVLVGDGSVNSYSETPVPSMMSGEFTHTSTVDIAEINAIVNGTIIFSCDNGVKFTMRDAACTKPCELTAGEGALSFEFQGPPITQTS